MVYVFFVSFVIFSIIDYIYIYTYLDSKILFFKPGSKLSKYIEFYKNENEVKSEFHKEDFFQNLSKVNLNIIVLSIIFFILMYVIKNIVFGHIINSNIVVIDLGYKKIEIVSAFEEYWQYFKKIYDIVYFIFLTYVLKKLYYNLGISFSTLGDRDIESVVREVNKDIYIGIDEQGKRSYIKEEGLYQNILITGSIGSGKTSSAISTICYQLMSQNIPGIILDIKGNYVDTVNKMARKLKKENDIVIISDKNDTKYNPLRNDISPIELAARIKQVICILSPNNSSDSYWLDKVENVLYNLIILIKYYNNNEVDFRQIHMLVTDSEYLSGKLKFVKERIKKSLPGDKDSYELSNVFLFFEKEYLKLDSRLLGIIKSEITRITIPFVTDFNIYNKFGKTSLESKNIHIDGNSNKIIILSINQSSNMVLSKVIATFLKLEFQKEVLSNISQGIKTFCICDEYQEFANVEDAHFLSLSREAKCINILSMQSYTSLINTLKNEKAALVIIQNLINKIWFRNDDNYTVEEAVKQIGVENKILTTKSYSEGSQETNFGIISRKFKNKKSNLSESISYVQNKDNVYNSNVFTRELKTFEAICFITSGQEINKIGKIKLERWNEYE